MKLIHHTLKTIIFTFRLVNGATRFTCNVLECDVPAVVLQYHNIVLVRNEFGLEFAH